MIIKLIFYLLVAYVAWTLACLEANVRKARKMQVPVVRMLISEDNIPWVIVQPLVWAALRCIPNIPWESYPDFVRLTHRNQNFLEKSRTITDHGSIWATASPAGISLHVADVDAIEDIFLRWRQFTRPIHKYKMLAIYGPSVFTVPLTEWPRHRKAVAASFSKSLMKLVWEETLRRTQELLHEWTDVHQSKIPSLEGDIRVLTFNVLAAVALQEPHVLKDDVERSRSRVQTIATYRDTLHVVTENSILLMLIPFRYLLGWGVPRTLAKIGLAAARFKSILIDIVKEEKAALGQDPEIANNAMLTPLVQAVRSETPVLADAVDDMHARRNSRRGDLSVDEILGNVFAINFAGHDTVLIALTFVLILLATEPKLQAWLQEEIETVFEDREADQDWSYCAFTRLHRCRAVFLETLRLYPPITGLPKIVTRNGATLRVGDRIMSMPPDLDVYPVLLGMQTNEQFWGPDANEWRPSRWILQAGAVAEEDLLVPRKGIFFPFSEGLQNCVGKDFAEVEAVAVLARIFYKHRLHPERHGDETEADARRRLLHAVNDVNYNLLLRVSHPENLRLECVEKLT